MSPDCIGEPKVGDYFRDPRDGVTWLKITAIGPPDPEITRKRGLRPGGLNPSPTITAIREVPPDDRGPARR